VPRWPGLTTEAMSFNISLEVGSESMTVEVKAALSWRVPLRRSFGRGITLSLSAGFPDSGHLHNSAVGYAPAGGSNCDRIRARRAVIGD
jgi:hypothetical protein